MTPTSALYRGTVRHTRIEPFHHDFSYRVYYGMFDIDELGALDRRLRWFSLDRFNLFGLKLADHGPADGSAWRPWVDGLLDQAGIDITGGRVLLLTYPRVLGYGFDPISEWYCYDSDGMLAAVLHEVRNTFGDRHTYVVPIDRMGLRHSFDKKLHVSPFNPVDQTYHFTLTEPGRRLTVSIDQSDDQGRLLRAGMNLTRLPLTDRNLLRLFWTHPLLTLKVIGGIHWQALRIRLKGGTYHRRPEPAEHDVTIVDRAAVTT